MKSTLPVAPKPAGKAVTISARISQEDALFLSRYQVDGAVTPSDKLRALLAEARERQQNLKDYRGSIRLFQRLLAPVDAEIRELEMQHQVHSELITRVLQWLPDMMALLIASENRLREKPEKQQLEEIEEGISDRLFRLIESILQMGVTSRCPCYRPDAINRRLEPVLDLASIISQTSAQGEGK